MLRAGAPATTERGVGGAVGFSQLCVDRRASELPSPYKANDIFFDISVIVNLILLKTNFLTILVF